MKALRYDEPWKLSVVELPEPIAGVGEALLRPLAVGICGSDVHGFTGESGRRAPGMVMGHEIVGEVISLGPNTKGLSMGQRVAVFNICGCGHCRFCEAGMEQQCPDKRIIGVNGGTWGGMAEQFTFPVNGLYPIAEELDASVGLLTEPLAVAIHAVERMRPAADQTIVIVGAGTIGIALVVALRARGVERVFILDKIAEKLELAEAFGGIPVNVDRENAGEVIRKATKDRGADGVFEAVGATATVRSAYELCGIGGTLVLVGNLSKEFTLPLQGVTSREMRIVGSYGFTRQDFGNAVDLVSDVRFPFERLITGHCSLEETESVMTRMARGELQATKMVIRI